MKKIILIASAICISAFISGCAEKEMVKQGMQQSDYVRAHSQASNGYSDLDNE